MTIGLKIKEFFYTLNAKDKYSDFDSRQSFNRLNKPDVKSSLLGSHQNGSTVSLSTRLNSEGVHEVRLAWRHVKKWLHKHCEDINASLLEACTEADIHEFEKDLGCQLPDCVVEFFRLTGGQSTFNDNGCSGLFYGVKLCPIDEIAVLTERWRKVHEEIKRNEDNKNAYVAAASEALSSARDKRVKDLFPPQSSIPPNTILPIYAHSMWIPFASDRAGNYIAIDLSHDPEDEQQAGTLGKWGQVILFGRDFDTKFKVADTFGDFLLIFANDLELGNWALHNFGEFEDVVCGVEADLVYRDHKSKKEMPYLDVLRTRATEKWLESLTAEEQLQNAPVLAQLKSKYSYEVPTFEVNTDSLITQNLKQFDISKGSEASASAAAVPASAGEPELQEVDKD
ncbi:hypothetical protein PUMCH_004822 [Australozyma saopauloensis]|uniref:Knr4/Smi1-like domain-containing protein n=1 Tax=Australozyma saopauloensis TaxID=291208 RepID=A0AAX4HHM3_9ASCO|nr:hypothetical protein PUMCH_004822 [[Candida] saopauloensis]